MKKNTKTHLKREISLTKLILSGIGIIFGAGIYTLIGKAAGSAGNMVWISFIFSAIIALFTGLSYGELASMYPDSSAEYLYTKKAINKTVGFLVSALVIISLIISTTLICFGFAGYLHSLLSIEFSQIYTVIFMVFLIFFVISLKIKETIWIGIIFTIIETLGLIFIIIVGIPHINTTNLFISPEMGFSGIVEATILIFFAYLGFEDMVKLSEETKNPKKNVPLALITAIIISTIIYILVALSAISILDPKILAESSSPIADIGKAVLGEKSYIILSIIALFATANTALFLQLGASRLTYGLSTQKILPKIFSKINPKTKTPIIASFFVTITALIAILLREIEVAAKITDLLLFIVFTIINLSVIILRYREKNLIRKFKVPLNIGNFPILPCLGIIINLFMISQFDFFSLTVVACISVVVLGGYLINEKLKNSKLLKALLS